MMCMMDVLLARLQTWIIIVSLVCESVCVCVSDRHFYPSALTDFDKTWSQGPYSDLVAVTIMVQIGRRGTARRLFENFKKFSKITEFEFQNSGPSFLHLYLLCIVKKFDSIRTKLTEEIDFEVCPYDDSVNGTAAAARCSTGYSD